MCSVLPHGTGVCCYAFMYFFEIFLLPLSIPFFILLSNVVLINRWNGPWYQHVLALCAFFNRSNTKGTNSSKKNLFDVCVFFLYICVVTDFAVFGQFVVWWFGCWVKCPDVVICGWLGSKRQLAGWREVSGKFKIQHDCIISCKTDRWFDGVATVTWPLIGHWRLFWNCSHDLQKCDTSPSTIDWMLNIISELQSGHPKCHTFCPLFTNLNVIHKFYNCIGWTGQMKCSQELTNNYPAFA